MTQNRNYSSTAQATTLASGINATQTNVSILSSVGFPPAPFIANIDYGNSSSELVLVTVATGTSWTVTRAYDTTSAASHVTGAAVQHVSAAIDFNEAGAHIGATSNVHGLAIGSSVVGTTDAQTLTNKTLTSPAVNSPSVSNASINTTGVATVPVIIHGITSQTADLQQWQDSLANVRFSVSSNGAPKTTSPNFASAYVEDTIGGNVTSTTYVDGPVSLSTTVVVPPSGKVLIMGTCNMFQNTNAATLYAVLNVVGSTSGTIRASSDSVASQYNPNNAGNNGTGPGHQSVTITSVNPGETLTVKWQHRVSSGTGGLSYRNISAIPLVG